MHQPGWGFEDIKPRSLPLRPCRIFSAEYLLQFCFCEVLAAPVAAVSHNDLHAMLGTVSLSLLAGLAVLASPTHAGNTKDKYFDYIVVGSGPGGGPIASNLAKAGYSVLLAEAGDNQGANVHSEVVSFFPIAYTDPTLRWDFFVRNFANETRNLQHNHLTWRRLDGSFYVGRDPPAGATLLGIHYPRGGTLGGSSAVNAMSTIYPSESDWQNVVGLTGDTTWR